MEAEALSENRRPNTGQHLFPAVVPVLFVAMGYVDPGKWAAVVDGGARFGFDLVLPVFIFCLAAILCQYLSARVAVVTGRDLAQICSEEYDKITCILLGVQAEVSMISLDLMMVLGTAHGLNVLFGIDLFAGVFLSAFNAFLFPLLATVIEDSKAKFVSVSFSIGILLFYVLGVFISQPGNTLSAGWTATRLSGETAFALMSLLGANIMPHNFYLHSAVVQQDQRAAGAPKEALCHGHLFATVCVFSGIFLVNYVLMSSAANVFYNSGLALLTFQDALSLMDQVFKSSIAPLSLILLMFLSSQVTALTWNLAGQVVVHDLFKVDIPGWLHHFTIRIIAIIPALYCVWSSGAEGIYQMLIFSQVVVALMLPSSVIPLFRVASSRPIMGVYKVSQFIEFLALITSIGMLLLKIMFFIELVFGSSDWVSNLRWNIGSGVPIAYVILIVAASVSFFLMLWLLATPLKSATARMDSQIMDWDIHSPLPNSLMEVEQNGPCASEYLLAKPTNEKDLPVTFENSLGSHPDLFTSSPNLNLPDTLFDSENAIHPRSAEDNKSDIILSTATRAQEPPVVEADISLVKSSHFEVSDCEKKNVSPLETETREPEEKTLRIEGEIESVKDDGDSWESEEPIREVSEPNQSLSSEGPGSFRSLSGKSDDVGSGTGSLSRLAGLGRAARRQFAAILDEFWGQMFDFHGQATQDAKAKKVDVLLGLEVKMDSKTTSPSAKIDSSSPRQDLTGYYPSLSMQGSDSLLSSGLYSSPRQQIGQGMIESSFGVQRGSSPLLSSHAQLLDAYVRSSSRNTFDAGERRYSSMHIPASSECYDQQPATVQGYELASYFNRVSKDRSSGFSSVQNELPPPKSLSSVSSHFRDSASRPLVKKAQNGMSILTPPGFHNVSRNNSLQSERSSYGVSSPKPTENFNNSATEKKFYSMPDISGLRIPYRDSGLPDKSVKWDSSVKYGQSIGYSALDRNSLTPMSRPEVPPGFGAPSSKVRRDAFSLQMSSGSSTGSLWSRQPYEQFGVADKTNADGEQKEVPYAHETPSAVDLEIKILQSFRNCIMKLLKLEGSDWLFTQNDGVDEDLIDRVAAREKFLYEAETVQMNWRNNAGEAHFSSERKSGSAVISDESDPTKLMVTSVPHCGEGCVYKVDLIISFGVWCIHRILVLSLMESRPELWGKYTYVLNRLQGIIDLAFFRPRNPSTPCFCLQLTSGWQQKMSPPISNGSLPPQSKQSKGKCTTATSLLEIVKDVETAISCRKGRTGTAAGDVAFPKGKENLASVLKRYKRRLSNKPIGSQDGGSGSRKGSSLHHGL
ncbi:OLC1v1034556C1 [Oldenlandia corymbosa var. corymbosa]|uniref:OLC1v1034556C1 n=1 Tax=Oldenlandia corymbosa var. corymbosa TaxID=529605 RepID=A0AAV1CQW8_OLDCO|nr:OLC1v1034556C1 [Oldenlandia corymbosa var. corymbosa]